LRSISKNQLQKEIEIILVKKEYIVESSEGYGPSNQVIDFEFDIINNSGNEITIIDPKAKISLLYP